MYLGIQPFTGGLWGPTLPPPYEEVSPSSPLVWNKTLEEVPAQTHRFGSVGPAECGVWFNNYKTCEIIEIKVTAK